MTGQYATDPLIKQSIELSGKVAMNGLLVSSFLLGFALPTSTALIGVANALILIFLAIVFFKNLHAIERRKIFNLVQEPLVAIPLILFILLALSLMWSTASQSTEYLEKYRKLLLILPFTIMLMINPTIWERFILGFLWGSFLALIFSYVCFLADTNLLNGTPSDPSVLKRHITHNFFMALAAIVWLKMMFDSASHARKILYGILFLLSAANVIFMVDGRTGQLTLLLSLVMWGMLWFWSRNILATLIFGLVTVVIICLYLFYLSPNFINGVNEILLCKNSTNINPSELPECNSSMGARYSFLVAGWDIIKTSPIGIGVGGFPAKVALYYHNPHNDYVLYTLQLGWAGLLMYLGWLGRLSHSAFAHKRLFNHKSFFNDNRLLVLFSLSFVVGNFFNSFSLDYIEGTLFVFFSAYLASLALTKASLAKEKITPKNSHLGNAP